MKISNLIRAGVALVTISFTAVACGTSNEKATNTSDASNNQASTCEAPIASIALQFPQTGGVANFGAPMLKGAQLAVDQFNSENPTSCVSLKTFDTQGDSSKAPAVALAIVDDATILGVVGPGTSDEALAALPLYDEAGLSTITGSATDATIQNLGFKVFHRVLASEATQGPAISRYILSALAPKSIGIVDDDSDYGKDLAAAVTSGIDKNMTATYSIDSATSDFAAAVVKMKDANADVIFFGGYVSAAVKFSTELRKADSKATLVFGDRVKDQAGYADVAGTAGEDALIACPCRDGNPDFIAAWQKAYKEVPGTYGAEYYDAANVFLRVIKAGAKDRAAVQAAVNAYDAAGITKQIKFAANGEATQASTVYMYKVIGGKITYLADTNLGN